MLLHSLHEAKRSKFLYHGTTLWGLAGIIWDMAIDEGCHWGRPGEPHGPRFFETARPARLFSHERNEPPPGGIIVLDRAVVEGRYKTVRYHDVDCNGERWEREGEEIVVLAKKMSIKDSLREIRLTPSAAENLKTHESIREMGDWQASVEEISEKAAAYSNKAVEKMLHLRDFLAKNKAMVRIVR